jgi:6-phosphogluconolactonase
MGSHEAAVDPRRTQTYSRFVALRRSALIVALLTIASSTVASIGAAAAPPAPVPPSNLVYITTNDPTPGQNAVLAFRRTAACALVPLIPQSRFAMQGTGVGNPNFRLGTMDSDQSLVVSRDLGFLYAVNAGSDSIAGFAIGPDGTLQGLNGSPYASRGHQPATLGIRGQAPEGTPDEDGGNGGHGGNGPPAHRMFVYAANKNEDPGQNPADFLPNYTAFRVKQNGSLDPLANSTVQVPQGSSPTQTLVSNDDRFVFSTDLLVDFPENFYPTDGFPAAPGAGGGNTLRSFTIGPQGRLQQKPGVRLPEPDESHPDPLGLLSGSMHISGTTNGGLGLQDHPTERILYVGFPFRFQLGVYTWNDAGQLSFVRAVGNSGQVPSHVQVSDDGTRLYTTNELDSTMSTYSLSDPFNPVEIDFQDLRVAPGATMGGLASQASLTPDGSCLYVLEQRITDAAGDGSANALHILNVSPTGLAEPFAPINLGLPPLSVPRFARPQGIAAF